MIDYQGYRESVEKGFSEYWKLGRQSGLFKESMRDPEHGIGRLPVFKIKHADKNIVMNPSATEEEKKRLLSLIPERKRHKWFRSMSSSQALALSFFGNLVIYGELEWLRDLKGDDGLPAFGDADLSPYNFSMEHDIAILNEARPTSLDVFISGRYRVAVECKLSETGFGTCSRPRQKLCDGSLKKGRCALAEAGASYWDHVPLLFKWKTGHDYDECPLKTDYQVVRNVLAACVREDGIVSPANGHALIIYDKRNPEFAESGEGTKEFSFARKALEDSRNLRKLSWQRLITAISRHNNKLNWLKEALSNKYGIRSDAE